MMQDDKNIDRLFQEKFKDFDALPDESVWANIEAKLDEEENNKVLPLLPFWLRRSVAIAVLLIGLGIITYINPFANRGTDSQGVNGIVNNPENTNDKLTPESGTGLTETQKTPVNNAGNPTNGSTENNAGVDLSATGQKYANDNTKTATASINAAKNAGKNYQLQQNNYNSKYNAGKTVKKMNTLPYSDDNLAAATEKEKLSDPAQKIAEMQKEGSTKDLAVNTLSSNSSSPIDNTFENPSGQVILPSEAILKDSTVVADNTNIQTLDDLLNNLNEEEEEEDKSPGKKWSINPNVAPVYFNSLADGSPISSDFSKNQKNGNINMSYGLNVAVQLSDKLSVRSGINNVEYGYSTNGVYFTNTTLQSQGVMGTINYSETGATIALANNSQILSPTFDSATGLNHVSESSAIVESSRGALIQNINYIEVPLEIKYNVLDSKLGINFIGGISTLFLSDNSILLESDGLVTGVGSANNINNINFSTNVGLGFNYNFAEKLQFNLEPMFKYQLNTFSDNNGFKPYTLGLYTGFSFRF